MSAGGPQRANLFDSTREPGWRELAVQLTAELRGVMDVHNRCGPSAEALREALELARALRAKLDGPRRERWYDVPNPKRPAYADMGPVRGALNPLAPPLRIRVLDRDPSSLHLEGRAILGVSYEAPPHGVHGGWVAALIDDLFSAVQGVSEQPGYTVSLQVRYHAVTPLDTELRLNAWLDRGEGRRLYIKGSCHAGETLTAEADAIFIKSDRPTEVKGKSHGR